MIELVIFACHMNNEKECKNFKLDYPGEVTLTQCNHGSMMEAAKWSGEHLQWQVRRWKCQEKQETAEKRNI